MKVAYVLGIRTDLTKRVSIHEILINHKLFKFFKALKYGEYIEICTMNKVGSALVYTYKDKPLHKQFVSKIINLLEHLPTNHRKLILKKEIYLSITYL